MIQMKLDSCKNLIYHSSYGSPKIGITSPETYSIFLEDEILRTSIVGFTEDYIDRLITIASVDNQHDFKSVIKHIKKEKHIQT